MLMDAGNMRQHLLFSHVDPSGKVRPEITNKNGNPNYKFFYSNADQGEAAKRISFRETKRRWCLHGQTVDTVQKLCVLCCFSF